MQLFLIIYFQKALQVSDGSSAHHQEHMRVHSASGIVNQYCCRLQRFWLTIPEAECTGIVNKTAEACSSIG